MQEWYYSDGGTQHGPVSFGELRAGLLNGTLNPETTLVWKTGMADWIAAANVAELAGNDPAAAQSAASSAAEPVKQVLPGSVLIDAVACLKRGFDLTVRNLGQSLLAMLLMVLLPFAIIIGVSVVASLLALAGGDNPIIGSIISLLVFAVFHASTTWLLLGLNRFCLNAVSGNHAHVSNLFGEASRIIPAIIGGIVFGIIVGIGFLLFIIPGIYLLARYGFFMLAIVDRKCGVMDAFAYSSQITANNRLNIVVVLLLSMVTTFLGALALGIGLLFAYPMVFIAWTVAYRWLQYGNVAAMDHPGTDIPMLAPRN